MSDDIRELEEHQATHCVRIMELEEKLEVLTLAVTTLSQTLLTAGVISSAEIIEQALGATN